LCKEQKLHCPAFPQAWNLYLPYSIGDTVSFQNSNANEVRFVGVYNTTSEAYVDNCRCKCECDIEGVNELSCIDCTNVYNSIQLKVYGEHDQDFGPEMNEGDYGLRLWFMNFYTSATGLQFKQARELDTTDSYFDQIELNGKLYADVYAFEDYHDYISDSTEYEEAAVWVDRIYYKPQMGVIAFQDGKSGELYTLVH
jgi:hypothetical protein